MMKVLIFIILKKLTKKTLYRTKSIVAIELDDILESRKLLLNKNKIIWLHSYGSIFCNKSYLSAPLFLPLEEGGTYINFEQKPQKATRLAVDLCNSITLDYFLNFMRFKIFHSTEIASRHFKFLIELLNSNKLFYKIGNLILEFNYTRLYFSSFIFINLLPTKTIIEDCYRTNYMLKQSLIMAHCSRQIRQYQVNLGYY